MEELKRPNPVNVEESFNRFVLENEGQLVSSLVSGNIDTKNADYFFDGPGVIAELKCFQKDLFNNEEDIPRLFAYFDKWKQKGLIEEGDELKLIFGRKTLPIECWQDLLLAVSKTIERAIHKGNKQIKETKILLKKPDAKGLLFLCNDGNYFVQNNVFLKLICDVMTRKYLDSEIDGFIYFTYNQTATIPGSQLDWQLWTAAYRSDGDELLPAFVDQLGSEFNIFYAKETGIPLIDNIIIDSSNEKVAEVINSMRHIPRDIIYKKD